MKFKINNLTPFLLAALQNPAFAAGEPQPVALNISGTLSQSTCTPGNITISLGDVPIQRIKNYGQPEEDELESGSYKVGFPKFRASACPSQNQIILELDQAEITPDSGTDHASGIKLVITDVYSSKAKKITYARFPANHIFEISNNTLTGVYVHVIRSGQPEDVKPGKIDARVTATIKIQ